MDRMGQRNHELDRGSDTAQGGGFCREEKGQMELYSTGIGRI